mmetsp:Transcript_4373/g.8103  ORF Transcript_4373/g.8103 Transcript_4373/m.8103 type:complete len:108 (-) Transcript_4373:1395-1718(-)
MAAAIMKKKPDTMERIPAFSIAHPFSQTPEAKNIMVMNMENEQRRYNTVMRFHAFGWYTTHIAHQLKIVVIPPTITAMMANASAAEYAPPKISFWFCQKPDRTELQS